MEIKRFHGKSAQTLVPRVNGRTLASGARPPGQSGHRLTRESFLKGFADKDVRAVAERFLDAAVESGGTIDYGASYGLSIRAKCRLWKGPISVAWLYSREGTGWMRTRDLSFGTGLSDAGLPKEVWSILKRWIDEFSRDGFAEGVSSKGVEAWAVRHDAGVQHQDVLVERLRRIVSELTSL